MTQLDSGRVLRKFSEQTSKFVASAVVTVKARWKLKKETSELPGFSNGRNAFFENLNIARQTRRCRVRELLPEFYCEFELIRRAFCPARSSLGITRVVERRIDFNSVEVAGIETKLVDFPERIENAGPGARTGSRRIAPAAGANPPDAGVIAFRRL
jgi:hypothetical protein